MADEQFVISVLVKQEVAKEFAKIESELKSLKNEISGLKVGETAFKGLERSTSKFAVTSDKSRSALDRLASAQARLREAQSQHRAVLEALTTEANKANKAINFQDSRLIQAEKSLQLNRDAVARLTKEYRSATVAAQGFINRLLIQRQGITDFGNRLDVAVKKIITYRLAFGAFRQGVDAIRDTFREVIALDNAFGDLQKILRTSQGELDTLRRSAFRLGKEFGRSADEIVSGFKTFAQQGLDTNGIIDRTQTLLLSVSATTLTTAESIEAITAAANIFGDEFSDLTQVIDKWLAVERQVPVAAKDLANALKGVGFVAKSIGLTLDELNGIVAAVGATTRKSGQAIANSFRTILARVLGDEAIEAFQNIGIAVTDAEGELRPFGDVLRDLNKEWDDLSERMQLNIAVTLGMKRRYSDFQALMENFDQFLKSTADSQGALNEAQQAAQVEVQKLSRRLEAVNTAFSELKEAVGEELIRSLVGLVESSSDLLANLTANASIIQRVILVTTSAAVIIGVMTAAAAFASTTFRFMGIDMVALALETRALTLSVGGLATAFTILRGVIVPALGVLTLVISAISLFAASTKEGSRANKEWGESLDAAKRTANLTKTAIEGLNTELETQKRILDRLSGVTALNKQIEQLKTLRKALPTTEAIFNPDVPNEVLIKRLTAGRFGNLREIDNVINALIVKRNELLFTPLDLGVTDNVDKGLGFQISIFDRSQTKVAKLRFEIDNLNETLARNAKVASFLGQPFVEAEERISIFRQGLSDLNNQLSDLQSERSAVQADIARGGTTFIDEKGRQRVRNRNKEDELKLSQRELQLSEGIKIIEQAILAFREKNKDVVRDTLNDLLKLKGVELQLERSIASQDALFSSRISSLRLISSVTKAASSNQLDSNKSLQRQFEIETSIIKLEEERKNSALDLQIAHESTKTDIEAQDRVLELLSEKEKNRIASAKKLNELQKQTVSSLVSQATAVQNQIASALSAAITLAPGNIAQRQQQEEELAARRAQLELELQAAREAGDQAAINQASRGLQELAIEARKIGNIFTDVFDAVANIASQRFQKITESLVDSLLEAQSGDFTIGQKISEAVTLGGTNAGNTIKNSIVKGSEVSSEAIESALITAGFTAADATQIAHEIGGQNAADKVKAAHQTGGNQAGSTINQAIVAGSQLLGQLIGGGGPGAARGAGIGGLVGSIVGSIVPGLGTVAGSAAGSLIGGVIGGRSDRDRLSPFVDLNDSVKQNTIAIENNNKLLELERAFINAPTRFQAPPTQGQFGGGINGGLTVQVFTGSNDSASDIGEAVVKSIDSAFSDTTKRSRSSFGPFSN